MKQTVDAAKAAAGKTIHERDLCSGRSAAGRDPADWAGIGGGQPGTKK